jgi:hypothetical protein
MTFEEGMTDLLAHLRLKGYSPATLDNYSDQLKRFGEWLRRKRLRDLRAVTRARVLAYQGYVRGESISRETQALRVRAVKRLYGHLVEQGHLLGPRAGQKVFSLQSALAREEEPRKGVAQYAGFSLRAGIGVEADQRGKLERLTRYVSRPPVSVERLDLTAQRQVRYRLKTPYRDGTTHIVLEPLDFIARLAALVPPPRAHLTRFHGVSVEGSRLLARMAGKAVRVKAADPDRRVRRHPNCAASTAARPMAVAIRRWL